MLDAEVFSEVFRRTKDNMLVLAIGKKSRIPFNPDVRLGNPTFGAEPRFTGMRDFLFFFIGRALVQMETASLVLRLSIFSTFL